LEDETTDMKSVFFVVVAALALMLTSSPGRAAGPYGAVAPAGGQGRFSARGIVQDRIVPGGFFRLPTAGPEIVKDRIVPGGFFSLPGGAHRRHFPRRSRGFIGAGVVAPPVIVVAPPVAPYGPEDYGDVPGSYYDPSGYPATAYNPPVVYAEPISTPVAIDPPAPLAPSAPPPPPAPTVIQYDAGRYELRGDGMTTPYTWVWIPNPPPPPPSGPPTAAAPGAPPFSDDAPAGRHGQLYRWTDEQGVVHLTDRLESVPKQYRVEAAQTPPS
jgi:hypothetical protein